MKLTFLFSFLVFLTSWGTSLSQTTKLSLHLQNVPIKKMISQIEDLTDFYFLYQDDVLNTEQKVTIQAKNASIESILQQAAEQVLIQYRIIDRQIVLYPEGDKKLPEQIVNLLNAPRKKDVITGTITDSKGLPLPGAIVLVKGSTVGTTANELGKYELSIKGDAILIFSFLGYKDYETNINAREIIDVVLLEDNIDVDEVIVVGYNSIEKKHLASSVEVINMDKVKTRPITSLQEGFIGTVAGAYVMQSNNLPGAAAGSIRIRGLGTLQNATPLVIIDGMEQSLTDIDPNQIKSMSVLKDAASASMYGSRGANGVIIIETERGTSGKFKVDLHSWFAIQQPIDLPNFVNSADYMRLNNEAKTIQSQPLLYTQEDIMHAEKGDDPKKYPNTNWLDQVMQRTAYSFNNSANISGGGGVGTFNLMLNYLDQKGLNFQEGAQRYSARFNTNINLANKFILLADFYAHRVQLDRLQANDDGHGLYTNTWKMNPTQAVYYDSDLPDHYMLHNKLNPVAAIEKGGSYNYLDDRSIINLRPRYYISENLHIAGDLSYMINKSASKTKRETFKFFDGNGKPVEVWANSVGATQGVSVSQITARGVINYEKRLRAEKDKVYFILGSELMSYNYTDFREVAKSSFFTKVNYSFENKYLLEGTLRADGSSKFAPGNRWGLFPSASLGWNITNEYFMKSIKDKGIVDLCKLRASYGLIGNENVDPYLWQESVNTWGWTMRVPNPNFTWEKQKQMNLGIDVAMLKNRLELTIDVYDKKSYDLIYSNYPVPPLTGSYYLTTSVNIGEVKNKGWEVSAKWSDNIGDFKYNLGVMVFDNRNEVLKAGYSRSDTLIFKDNNDKIWYKGIAVDNYYGYRSNGFFKDQADVNATAAKLPNTLPGDIKYVDQNKDGIINYKDKVNLGDPFPHYNYTINLDLSYKNWDLAILGQGVGKRTGRLSGLEGYPVIMDGASNSLGTPRQEYMDNRWTPNNQNSRFPRVWTGASTNANLSDVWLSDASFFRIKTIQIGYSLPNIWKSIKNVRVYFNAQDAITFTKWEGLEPERNGGNGTYPRMGTFSFGIKATIL